VKFFGSTTYGLKNAIRQNKSRVRAGYNEPYFRKDDDVFKFYPGAESVLAKFSATKNWFTDGANRVTSPEHTLVGILGALSLGLHKKLGWPAVVFAGIISNVPDWDGVPMFVDMARFEAGHRVWGHNFLVIVLTSWVLAAAQFRFHVIENLVWRFRNFLPKDVSIQNTDNAKPIPFFALLAIALLFQSVHLVCDMVVSGGSGLSDWHVQPLWPFSNVGFVFPLIRWGDVGPTVIMMGAAIVAAKYSGRARLVASCGLASLIVYMIVQWFRHLTSALV